MGKKKKVYSEDGHLIDSAAVLHQFRQRKKPLGIKELLEHLGLHRRRREELFSVLDELVLEGKIIKLKDAWGLSESMNLVSGVLEIQRSGVGFVIPDDKRRKDIFIRPGDFGDAWHGDHVVAAVTKSRAGKSSEGRIARVIERGVTRMACRVLKRFGEGFVLCQPTDPRHTMRFMADWNGKGAEPREHDVLMVEIQERLEMGLYSGAATENLGQENQAAVQENLVKENHGVPRTFPGAALAEAAALPENPGDTDFQGRTDLRSMDFVTIDGAKARDFDDAVCVARTSRGYRLWVAIADVAHYVAEGSALDKEAQERGNSYYFPQSVEPMFPEALSNGLCSLRPYVPRLTMVAQIDFSKTGIPGQTKFYPAVIQSKERLTYDQVNEAIILNDADKRAAISHVADMLDLCLELARKLAAKRHERGSLDFDLPEAEIHFDIEGQTEDIRPRERHFAHQLIEEFMVAANEAVARRLTEQQVPTLYRVHPQPDPDKLKNLFGVLVKLGLAAQQPKDLSAKALQQVLAQAQGTDQEYLVSRMTLRSMMQARYDPVNDGHFGLASTCYCHFTSPIRRYADVLVHRGLKALAAGNPGKAASAKRLAVVADVINKRERVAVEAEREILKRLTVLFLEDRVGQSFTGVVSGLTDFGFWVELVEVMAEGMVRLSSLSDDYYAYLPERAELVGERSGRRIRLGQSVAVTLTDVNLSRLEVNLSLGDGEEGGKTGASGGGARKGKSRRSKGSRGGGGAKSQAQARTSGEGRGGSSGRRRGKKR